MDNTYNPYQPPVADLHLGAPEAERRLAGRGRRFANFVIDVVCYYLVAAIFGFGYGLYLALSRGPEAVGVQPVSELVSLGLGILAFLLYFTVWEGFLGGRTVGKLITGTRVVREDGAPLTLGTVLKRSLSRLIPFEPFSFLFGGEPVRGWHDEISDTLVVRTR